VYGLLLSAMLIIFKAVVSLLLLTLNTSFQRNANSSKNINIFQNELTSIESYTIYKNAFLLNKSLSHVEPLKDFSFIKEGHSTIAPIRGFNNSQHSFDLKINKRGTAAIQRSSLNAFLTNSLLNINTSSVNNTFF
jgi:hypothetical protein